jgi:transposase
MINNPQYPHAKRHADWRPEQPARLDLEFLPPDSPERNPIERVWQHARRNCLHNGHFPKQARVVEAVETQFAKGPEPNAVLANRCHP